MNFKNALWVFFISMLPLIELRGAVPVGAVLELPFYVNFICAVIGNMLPVPFILLFIPKILDFMYRFRIFRPIVCWLRKKADKNADRISAAAKDESINAMSDKAEHAAEDRSLITGEDASPHIPEAAPKNTPEAPPKGGRPMPAGAFIGLLLFVLLPAPGTGAWTGALVAALFEFPKMKSFLSVLLGVIGCGIIMSLASYGVLGFLSFLL